MPRLLTMKVRLIEDNPALQATVQRALQRGRILGVACTDGALPRFIKGQVHEAELAGRAGG